MTLAAIAAFLLVVYPSLPVKSVKDLVALARKRPGELAYGSGGIGSPGHLSGELLGTLAGISMVHVAYKGAAPALVDAMSGQIQVYFANLPVTLPHATSGKPRPLAVTSPQRAPAVLELPTVADAGVPGFELSPWHDVMTRAGVPEAILDRIESDTVRALRDPEMRGRIVKLGGDPAGTSRSAFAAFLRSEAVKWGRLVKASGGEGGVSRG